MAYQIYGVSFCHFRKRVFDHLQEVLAAKLSVFIANGIPLRIWFRIESKAFLASEETKSRQQLRASSTPLRTMCRG